MEKNQAKRVNDTFSKSKEWKKNENVETGVIYNIGIKLVKY